MTNKIQHLVKHSPVQACTELGPVAVPACFTLKLLLSAGSVSNTYIFDKKNHQRAKSTTIIDSKLYF